MRKLGLTVLCLCVAAAAFAQEGKAPEGKGQGAGGGKPASTGQAGEAGGHGDPMAGWTPRKVQHADRDRKEIAAYFKAMEAASAKGDLDAAAALIDFPVLMVTDDKKGEAMGDSWDREKWAEVMKPFYTPNPEMKVTHKPQVFLITDSLATVDDEATVKMGGKTMVTRNSMLLIRKNGKWLAKTMVEGGWGDMMSGEGTTPAASGSR